MGGLNPLYEPSPRLVFPSQRRGSVIGCNKNPFGWHGNQTPRANPEGATLSGGVSRSSPAPDGPPNLGIARMLLGSIY